MTMTFIRISIFLLGFLATSAMAYRLQFRELDIQKSSGNETGNDLWHFEDKVDEQLPGVCWVCKWIVNKVKQSLPRDNSETKNEVKNKLQMVCDSIGFLKFLCKIFISKYIDILVEELSTTDSETTICVNLQVCSSKSTEEDIVFDAMEAMWRKKIS